MSVNHFQGAVRQLPPCCAVPSTTRGEAAGLAPGARASHAGQVSVVGQVKVEPGPRPGVAWPGIGIAAAPQAQLKGSSAATGTRPRCSQPHPSSLVHCYAAPCAQSLMLATQSGLPRSFLLPGDFSAVRSYDCSLKGRALLAEGDVTFSLYKQ